MLENLLGWDMTTACPLVLKFRNAIFVFPLKSVFVEGFHKSCLDNS